MNVWDAIKHKRAIRDFRPEPLAAEAVQRIVDAGRRAQSSKNSQPWHFIAITDRDRLAGLSTCGQYLGHVAGAALCVAIVTPAPEDNERYPWHMFDAGQSAAYMQLAALELGVGSCLGTVYDEDKARDLLGFPADRALRIVISFGYPRGELTPTRQGKGGRRPLEDVVHWNRW